MVIVFCKFTKFTTKSTTLNLNYVAESCHLPHNREQNTNQAFAGSQKSAVWLLCMVNLPNLTIKITTELTNFIPRHREQTKPKSSIILKRQLATNFTTQSRV